MWCSRLCVACYILEYSSRDAQARTDDVERESSSDGSCWHLLLSTMHHMPIAGVTMGRRDLQLVKCPRHYSARLGWSPLRLIRRCTEVERRQCDSPRTHFRQQEHHRRFLVLLL